MNVRRTVSGASLVLGLFALGAIGCHEARESDATEAQPSEVVHRAQEAQSCQQPSNCRTSVVSASKTIPFPPPQAAPSFSDGDASFVPAMKIAVPAQIPVIAGNSGHGRVALTVATAAGAVTCMYEGYKPLPHHPEKETPANPGDRYVFLSCSNGASPGTQLTANSVHLHLQSSSFNAGTTTVRLTLAEQAPCAGGFDCSAAVLDDGNPCTADACSPVDGRDAHPGRGRRLVRGRRRVQWRRDLQRYWHLPRGLCPRRGRWEPLHRGRVQPRGGRDAHAARGRRLVRGRRRVQWHRDV
ncbi:MAG: hypothetical protein U0414_30600 [Polyangiaceae bacterium]